MRALAGEMWMTTLIMLPGHLMVQGALACRDETAPTRQEVVSRRAASKIAFLPSLNQATLGSTLPVSPAPS
jgi:hypothetical protein